MFTLHHDNAQTHKSASKTLLRLLAVVALLLASSWVVDPSDQNFAVGDPAQAEHAAHMGNFNWAEAISAAHNR